MRSGDSEEDTKLSKGKSKYKGLEARNNASVQLQRAGRKDGEKRGVGEQ